MKNPGRMDAAGIQVEIEALQDRESLNSSSLRPGHEKSKSEPQLPENTARRDAAAMVKILDKMKSGWKPYEIVYDSLKQKHGKPFEEYFRNYLAEKGGRDD